MVQSSDHTQFNETDFVKSVREKYADKISSYGFKLEAPVNEDKAGAKYYFIRHGMSMYNYYAAISEKDKGKDSEEFIAGMKDEALVDPDLHDMGRA